MELAVATNAAQGHIDVRGRKSDPDADLERAVDADLERRLIGTAIDTALGDVELDPFIADRDDRLVGARRRRKDERAGDHDQRRAKPRDQCGAAGAGDGEACELAGSTKRDAAWSWIRTLR